VSGFTVGFRAEAAEEFHRLRERSQRKVAQIVEGLAANPFYPGTKALQGDLSPFRRARAGDYRVIYLADLETKHITIVAIGLRADIYRRLSRMSL